MINESGRTLTETLATLVIIGLLSFVGLAGYSYIMRQKSVDAILEALEQKVIEIDSAQVNRSVTTPDELNAFLAKFETDVGDYKLSFYASTDNDGSYISEVTYKDGSKIKGAFCRQLIRKMAEQQFVSDVDFSLKNEVQEDGSTQDINIPLHGKTVVLDDICGK